jgi:hypothetical protein
MHSNLYLVQHIPKTAGTTLHNNFRRNFKDDEWLFMFPHASDWKGETLGSVIDAEIANSKQNSTRCVFGHLVYWGIHEKLCSQMRPRYITVLRDPVERCISLYGFVKSRPENRYYRPIAENNWSLGDWLKYGNIHELSNGQIRRLLFDGSNDIWLEPHLTQEHLEAAKQRLREFWFVGLTETFDQDSHYLYGKLNFRHFHPPRVVNATVNKPVATAKEREALTEANQLDIELYKYVYQMHMEWVQTNQREYNFQQNKARIIKKVWPKLSFVRRPYHILKSASRNRA